MTEAKKIMDEMQVTQEEICCLIGDQMKDVNEMDDCETKFILTRRLYVIDYKIEAAFDQIYRLAKVLSKE